MISNELFHADILQDVFELPEEWAKALYSIQYCLTKHSITKENNVDKKRLKEKWLQDWEKWIIAPFNIKSEESFSLVCDDLALEEYLRKLNLKTKQKSHAYLIIIEALFFRPYFPLGVKDDDKEFLENKLKYKLDLDYLSTFSIKLNINKKLLNGFNSRFKKSWMVLSGKTRAIVGIALVSAVAIAVTAGALAPKIAILFAAPGLYGAAAISSGLAALGGGAIATGGSGMAAGLTVLVTTGGILGIAGGAGIGALVSLNPQIAVLIAAKLEVYFRNVLLPILDDPETARGILKGLEFFILSLNDDLVKKPRNTKEEKKNFKLLQKTIKVLQRSLARNRKTLLDYDG